MNAAIHRVDMGSLAHVWIGDHEHIVGTTSEAHALMARKGRVEFVDRHRHANGSSVENYVIHKTTAHY